MKQLRASGGVWIASQGIALHLDPGPGALVRALSSRPPLDPATLSGVILSHRHLDHANDVNVILEAMTQGATRVRGHLFLPSDALGEEPVVFRYLKEQLEGIHVLQEGGEYVIDSLRFATPLRHIHGVETYGFKFFFPQGIVSFITDTQFTEKLFAAYEGSDVLVVHTLRLERTDHPDLLHLSVPEVELLLLHIRPRLAILTHFGMTILRARPWEVADRLAEKCGLPVIAAYDGLVLDLATFSIQKRESPR
ncbi:MAG: MBL fold metallo-hydrolase [Candidatus Caldatribacterium sp.]|uniref:MBL fold metallo-hydrolase n=1 Tax=Candidatus Caldatribacterium sp. TaxID=2282143 RepID=UPI0037EDAEE5|nr:MBL fold metallo-hydrolase [Candidatus Caldatribacterium sp.]MCX7730870.1 MBL fold metallo-hydrolase [Candidatus Caldatribacterium sp.]